ncbi:MAG TPA: helix-turn-helix domain-containing protein [Bacillota bacterium]|nr:helix-turn-helix domain-containing protein [Bacillota bacterium]
MKDHIETDEERRIRQYEAMGAEQKAMVFQKITAAFGSDAALKDPRKLVDKAERTAEKATKSSTKVGHWVIALEGLTVLKDEANVLFRKLDQSGESPDPEVYQLYIDEIAALERRVVLTIKKLEQRAEIESEQKAVSEHEPSPSQPAAQPVFSEILDIDEAAAFTKLSASTLYHKKSIPRHKVDGKLLFSRKELEDYILSRSGGA